MFYTLIRAYKHIEYILFLTEFWTKNVTPLRFWSIPFLVIIVGRPPSSSGVEYRNIHKKVAWLTLSFPTFPDPSKQQATLPEKHRRMLGSYLVSLGEEDRNGVLSGKQEGVLRGETRKIELAKQDTNHSKQTTNRIQVM